ncbi:hypothetical protein D9M68_748960 [compost metagenome]
MAGAGEAAGQGDLAEWQVRLPQQLLGAFETPCQQITMRRQAETQVEHAREMVLGQRTEPGQLAQAQRLGQMHVDVLAQPPPL